MKISTWLASGFGLLILLFIICTGIALNALSKASDGMDDVTGNGAILSAQISLPSIQPVSQPLC